MKTTHPITYLYEYEGQTIAITRVHVGTAYARNGNVGNPTEYFTWQVKVDSEPCGYGFNLRADAYEYALGHGYCLPNGLPALKGRVIRPFTLVADEMKANYRGKVA